MKRVLAIVGAVVIVAAAVVARSKIHPSDGSHGILNRGDKPVVACTPDLQPLCDALAADGAIKPTDPIDIADIKGNSKLLDNIDGWLTWDGAPGIVTFDLGSDQASPWDTPTVVGSGKLGVAYTPDGLLSPACAKTWRCIASKASGDQDAPVIGVGDGTTAISLQRYYPLALALAKGDIRGMEPTPLKTIEAGPAGGPNSATLDRFLVAVGSADGVVDLEDLVARAKQTARDNQDRTVLTSVPTPTATATVVLVARTGHSLKGVAASIGHDREAAALRDLGLTPGGRLAPDGRAGELFQIRDKVEGN
jgi:hypothetical protein